MLMSMKTVVQTKRAPIDELWLRFSKTIIFPHHRVFSSLWSASLFGTMLNTLYSSYMYILEYTLKGTCTWCLYIKSIDRENEHNVYRCIIILMRHDWRARYTIECVLWFLFDHQRFLYLLLKSIYTIIYEAIHRKSDTIDELVKTMMIVRETKS